MSHLISPVLCNFLHYFGINIPIFIAIGLRILSCSKSRTQLAEGRLADMTVCEVKATTFFIKLSLFANRPSIADKFKRKREWASSVAFNFQRRQRVVSPSNRYFRSKQSRGEVSTFFLLYSSLSISLLSFHCSCHKSGGKKLIQWAINERRSLFVRLKSLFPFHYLSLSPIARDVHLKRFICWINTHRHTARRFGKIDNKVLRSMAERVASDRQKLSFRNCDNISRSMTQGNHCCSVEWKILNLKWPLYGEFDLMVRKGWNDSNIEWPLHYFFLNLKKSLFGSFRIPS